MKTPRNAKLSLMAAIEAILESTSHFDPAYTVYYESDLRDYIEDKLSPDWPYCFILDANVMVEAEFLPAVVVWLRWSYRGLELSSTKMWHCDLSVDVYGRNRGEREDIAAGIVEGMGESFTIYDYSGATATTWGTASIYESGPSEYWTVEPQSVADEYAVEGTTLNWMQLGTRFWCKAT